MLYYNSFGIYDIKICKNRFSWIFIFSQQQMFWCLKLYRLLEQCIISIIGWYSHKDSNRCIYLCRHVILMGQEFINLMEVYKFMGDVWPSFDMLKILYFCLYVVQIVLFCLENLEKSGEKHTCQIWTTMINWRRIYPSNKGLRI